MGRKILVIKLLPIGNIHFNIKNTRDAIYILYSRKIFETQFASKRYIGMQLTVTQIGR